MTIVREIIARFGVDVDASDLGRLDSSVGGVLQGVQRLAAAFAGWQVTQRVVAFTQEMVNAGDAIAATSSRLAIGTTELQELQHAATMSDVAVSTLESGMEGLSRRALGAVSGNRTLARTFSQLGVELRDRNGQLRSSADLFTDLADGIAAVESPTERTGLAMRLFGGAGADLVPLLARGSAGVAELRAEFHALGGGLSEETVEAAAELDDQFNRLDATTNALRGRIALYLLPVVERGVDLFVRASSGFLDAAESSHVFELAISALAGVAAYFATQFVIAYAGPIAIFLLIAAAVGFLILVVDDLITMFEGGTSVIGGFIDELFGVGTTAQLVATLTESWQGFMLAVRDAIRAVREFLGLPVGDQTTPGTSDPNAATPEGVRRAAQLEGNITGARGATFEEALAETNATRQAAGLAPLGPDGQPTASVRGGGGGRTARVRGGRGAGSGGPVDARTDVAITVQGSMDTDTADHLTRRLDETLERRHREAAATLGGAVDDEEG